MKKLILCIFLSLTATGFAYDYSYDVSGIDENGNLMQGTIYSNNGDSAVIGEIYDENGNLHDFEGRWNGYGAISGDTDDGISVDLNTD